MEFWQNCAKIIADMNMKLFLTLFAAIVLGGLALYIIFSWLRRQEQALLTRVIQPKGEIGFAAIAKLHNGTANA